ncbi:hydroxymyristoyl-ACP dehydratase [Proteiniborus sp. MB09-C3]|uniref:hydroxymyristoyl-ACP dehydratase n=1 Tax=Proteiniborus sp. MB09-C3 TaxID=3050072 RepID=UPI002552A80D|nr:hydroxymyristoyl-ACP dehydratase [Proteiniborus sp. MB09-C3]WIV11890.1 hydroxymyristoyl-ACP dehydratase [Proteiniborus sp. MB09-C3]
MTINCSEKCLYENEGICTLNRIIISSGNISSGCPYFKNKHESQKNIDDNLK